MLLKFKRHIPQFIIEKYLLYTDILTDCDKSKSCLVLTNQLKFFEYKNKELLNSIDLQQSCLHKIKTNLNNYQGTYNKLIDGRKLATNPTEVLNASATLNINFGKYIFHYMDIKRFYILIQCWDKLIVLERLNDCKGFQLVKEYENFCMYKIIHSDSIKYCAMIEMRFQDGKIIKTDFQSNQFDNLSNQSPELLEQCFNSAEFKDLMERICSARSELNVHEDITTRAYHRIKQHLTYGLPYLRSMKVEEKQMLARCGDIWKRLTLHNHLIIGVPLVNQCAPPNLTTLKNIQPVLQISLCNTEQNQQSVLQCEYRLYQLQQVFHNLDLLEAFLQSEDGEVTNGIWFDNNQLELLPNSFGVLVMKYNLSDIVHLGKCPLYVNYEICKDYALNPSEETFGKTYTLQIFLQTIDFQQICFQERLKYEIKFHKETIQQDFLAIAMSSFDLTLKCTFNCLRDYDIFMEVLLQKYDLSKIYNESDIYDFNDDIDMENCLNTTRMTPITNSNFLLCNCKSNSLWYGLLILQLHHNDNYLKSPNNNCNHSNDSNQSYTSLFKFYLPNAVKCLIYLKSLFFDLISNKCNVVKIEKFCGETGYYHLDLGNLDNCLRQELNYFQDLIKSCPQKYSENWFKNIEQLYKLQLATDLSNNSIHIE